MRGWARISLYALSSALVIAGSLWGIGHNVGSPSQRGTAAVQPANLSAPEAVSLPSASSTAKTLVSLYQLAQRQSAFPSVPGVQMALLKQSSVHALSGQPHGTDQAATQPPSSQHGRQSSPTTPSTHAEAAQAEATDQHPKSAEESTEKLAPLVWSGPAVDAKTGKKVVYLTFDDGPTPYLGEILDALDQAHAKGTFFWVGNRLQSQPTQVRRAVREGNSVGSHTWDHGNLKKMSTAQQASEIDRADDRFQALLGLTPLALRPPYGNYNTTTRELAGRRGNELVMWNEDPRDWALAPTQMDVLEARVVRHLQAGAIFDMHESRVTARALPPLLKQIAAAGYEVRALPLLYQK
ncbi:MAG: polysaccharide deacetylase family protein [Firmicutes bacterium]|nr:polysaccharide deacetylase family protein [Bacillota bacterium]